MSLLGVASAMGVTTSALEDLIRGKVSVSVAGRFGALSSSLEDFIDGEVRVGIASQTGILSSTLQELRGEIGREGAIGFIIGYCVAKSRVQKGK